MASTVKEKALEASKSEVIQLRRALRRTERDAAASKVASTAAAAKARDTIGKFANAFNKMREAKGESDRTVAELRAAVARITLETEVAHRNQQREMEATFDDLRDDFDEQLAMREMDADDLREENAAMRRRVAELEAAAATHNEAVQAHRDEALKAKSVLMFERAADKAKGIRAHSSPSSLFERSEGEGGQLGGVPAELASAEGTVGWERARAAHRLIVWANRSIESAAILPLDAERPSSGGGTTERNGNRSSSTPERDPASAAADSRWEQLEQLMRRFLEVAIPGAKRLRLRTLRMLKAKTRGYDRDPPVELTPRLDRSGASSLGFLTEFLEDNGRVGGTMSSVVGAYTQHIDPAFPTLVPVRKKGRAARAERKARFASELRSAIGTAGTRVLR